MTAAVNMSRFDRSIRAVIAAGLLLLFAVTAAWPVAVLAGFMAFTAVSGRCPLYRFYGISTVGGLHKTACGASCGLAGLPVFDRGVADDRASR